MKYVIGVLVLVIVLLLTFGGRETIVDNTDYSYVKVLEDSIYNLNAISDSLEIKSNSLKLKTDAMYITLKEAKETQDTSKIIEVQDSIIDIQKEEILTLNTRIGVKELVVTQTNEMYIRVINDKDNEIADLRRELKKERRKRIVTTVVSAALIIGTIAVSL